ncbi:hypothetical protein [Planotetraspora kaengkrachanensis]|uniref:hypothetical protein n=1 Tax=Planotetraspora kaengkrachanensis TaxID=575193 RepID=UPI0031E748E5
MVVRRQFGVELSGVELSADDRPVAGSGLSRPVVREPATSRPGRVGGAGGGVPRFGLRCSSGFGFLGAGPVRLEFADFHLAVPAVLVVSVVSVGRAVCG